jgi:hypothetical protein
MKRLKETLPAIPLFFNTKGFQSNLCFVNKGKIIIVLSNSQRQWVRMYIKYKVKMGSLLVSSTRLLTRAML